MKLKRLMIFTLSIVICSFAMSSAVTLYPVADMYIDTIFSEPHSQTELLVAEDLIEPHVNEALMKFDLEPYMGAQIDEAILYLYRFYGCGEGNTVADIYEILQDWDEATWPEDQQIEHGTNSWARHTFSIMGYNAIDITYIVQAWLDNYITNYGFVIKGINSTRLSRLYSREAAENVVPYLEITDITDIEVEPFVPSDVSVMAYPNPFNARTTISYTLSEQAEVTLEIYDILGRRVETLVSQTQPAGLYQTTWNAGNVSSGAYFYRLSAGDYTRTEKIVLLK